MTARMRRMCRLATVATSPSFEAAIATIDVIAPGDNENSAVLASIPARG